MKQSFNKTLIFPPLSSNDLFFWIIWYKAFCTFDLLPNDFPSFLFRFCGNRPFQFKYYLCRKNAPRRLPLLFFINFAILFFYL